MIVLDSAVQRFDGLEYFVIGGRGGPIIVVSLGYSCWSIRSRLHT